MPCPMAPIWYLPTACDWRTFITATAMALLHLYNEKGRGFEQQRTPKLQCCSLLQNQQSMGAVMGKMTRFASNKL